MVALSAHCGHWYPLCCWVVGTSELGCSHGILGAVLSSACPLSVAGSLFLLLSLERVQRGQTMPGAAGQWEQPPGQLPKPPALHSTAPALS